MVVVTHPLNPLLPLRAVLGIYLLNIINRKTTTLLFFLFFIFLFCYYISSLTLKNKAINYFFCRSYLTVLGAVCLTADASAKVKSYGLGAACLFHAGLHAYQFKDVTYVGRLQLPVFAGLGVYLLWAGCKQN